MPNHSIQLSGIKTMISRLLNDPTLGNIAKNESIGGLIDMSSLDLKTFEGGAFWHCWNTEYMSLPKFFLAFEENDYNQNSPGEVEPQAEYLMRSYPNYLFRYPYESNTEDQVEYFLTHPAKEWDQTKRPDVAIDDETVWELNQNFMNNFPYGGSSNPFNVNSYGFFNASELDSFRRQGPYARYYYGLEDDNSPNRIKMILIAVDAQGANIISGSGPVMVEHSWPP